MAVGSPGHYVAITDRKHLEEAQRHVRLAMVHTYDFTLRGQRLRKLDRDISDALRAWRKLDSRVVY